MKKQYVDSVEKKFVDNVEELYFDKHIQAIYSILWDLKRDMEKDFSPFYNSKETMKEVKRQKNKIIALTATIDYIRYHYGKYIFK